MEVSFNVIVLILIALVLDKARADDVTVNPSMDDEFYHKDLEEYDSVCKKDGYREILTEVPNTPFHGITRIVPNKVGEERLISIEGKKYTIITRALQPPIFEVLNYLSDEECEGIQDLALEKGLFTSYTLFNGTKTKEGNTELNASKIDRVSEQAWLVIDKEPEDLLITLRKRLISATGLPREIIEGSEGLQVVRYQPGGHYHAHYDASNYDRVTAGMISEKNFFRLPCCDRKRCGESMSRTCCRLCRYMTVMYYLNDVEEGGHTAFVNAVTKPNENRTSTYPINLSYNCPDSKLLLTPRKGSMIIWYNHLLDLKTGWLGKIDLHSIHGGCDVIKGEKWIANNWISVPSYKDRYSISKYKIY